MNKLFNPILHTLDYLIFGSPPTMLTPNVVTINSAIVNVTLVASATAPARKKKSKREVAETTLASKLETQPVKHDYVICSNNNMKRRKWRAIETDDNVRSHLYCAKSYQDSYF